MKREVQMTNVSNENEIKSDKVADDFSSSDCELFPKKMTVIDLINKDYYWHGVFRIGNKGVTENMTTLTASSNIVFTVACMYHNNEIQLDDYVFMVLTDILDESNDRVESYINENWICELNEVIKE